MSQPSHMVSRLVMAVDLATQERVDVLQERFAVFCQQRLPALLDTILSRFSTPLQSRVLSQLELDLGSVPERAMEAILAERIEQALHERLFRLLGFPVATKHDAPINEHILKALAEGLSQRAQRANQHIEIDRLMQAALAAQSVEVAALLRKIGGNPLVRWHLARALRDVTLIQVVQVLRPGDAAAIIEYAEHIQIQQKHTQAIPIPETDFKYALWEVIFAYLLADRGSQFNRYTFIDSILRRLAECYGLNYFQLLDGLLHQVVLPVSRVGRDESLLTILFRLRKKALPVDPCQKASSVLIQGTAQPIHHGLENSKEGEQIAHMLTDSALTIDSPQRWLSALAMFLEHGVLPWFAPHTANAIQVLFNSLIETSPHLLASWLRTALIHTVARNRLATQLSSDMRGKILCLMMPDQADVILQWLTPLASLLRCCIERQQPLLIRSSTFSEAWLIEEVWIAIFEFVTQTQQGKPSSYAWLRTLLQRTAAQNGLAYTSLLISLVLEVKARSSLVAATHDLHTALLSLHAEALIDRAHWSEVKRRLAWLSGARATLPAHDLSLFFWGKRFTRQAKETARVDESDNSAYRCLLWLSQGIWPFADPSQEDLLQAKDSRYRRAKEKEKSIVQHVSPHLHDWLNSLPDRVWRWALQHLKKNDYQVAAQRIVSTPIALRLRVFRLLVAPHQSRAVVELMKALTQAMQALSFTTATSQQAQIRLLSVMLSVPFGTSFVQTIRNLMQLLAVHYVIPVRRWFEVLYQQTQTDKKGTASTLYHLLKRVETWMVPAFATPQKNAAKKDLCSTLKDGYAIADSALVWQGGITPLTKSRKDSSDFLEENLYNVDIAQLASIPEQVESGNVVLDEKNQLDTQAISATSFDALEGLCYFLDHGVLPKGERWRSFSSAQWFEHAFIKDKQAALDALRARANRPDVLKRLWAAMPSSVLTQLITWLFPQHAQSIVSLLLAGEALQNDATLSGAQQARTAQLHWQLALSMLLNPHAPTFSLQTFLDQISTQAAQRLGLSVDTYTQCLLVATHQHNQHADEDKTLVTLLKEKLPESATESVQAEEALHNAAQKVSQRLSSVSQLDQASISAPSSLQILNTFLRFGQLPAGGFDALAEAVKRLHSESSVLLRRRLRVAIGNALERTRLAWLLPWYSFLTWLRWLWPMQYKSIQVVIEGLTQIAERTDGRTAFWRSTVIEILLIAFSHRPTQRWQWHDLLHVLIQHLIEQQPLAPALVIKELRAKFVKDSVPTALFTALDWVELSLLETKFKTIPKQHALTESLRLRATTTQPQVIPADKTENPVSLPAEEPFYIHNAGLVLLWPFLTRYLQILELVEARDFRNPAAQYRAIYLLQYLVTGSLNANEPELLLNKILCGALDAPNTDLVLARHLPLSECEIAISEDILYGVTQNWEKLRNTSIAGLQTSFLLRDGKLEKRKDETWTLTVSLKAYDVLLDSLPWGLSMIRLPWMKNLLHVRWR